jgi:hypothetical protein
LSTAALRAAIDRSGLDFRSEPEHGQAQLAAIYALGQGGALSLLTGVAGAGKTALLGPLTAAWQADTRFSPEGREVVGIATAWRQADALKEAGINSVFALQPLLHAIEQNEFRPTRNTVLVIDELSQIGPRPMLKLLELQARTGMTIKGLADPEQAQAIEAGSAVEILRRTLPKEALPEILTTVRQASARDRTITRLFRDANAAEALALKREDGTAQLIGGDHDQVLSRIAEFYLARRDILRAAGSKRSITISVLTNEDAADVSRAIRTRLKERGEIGQDEKICQAVAPRGPTEDRFDLPIATGDRLRLYRRTWGKSAGRSAHLGNNGDIVEVVGHMATGLRLRNKDGRVGEVEWRNLCDGKSGRLMLGFGHALTIDAAQGITSDEHIDALPRGRAGITAFKAYVAESRARYTNWTMVSEAAVHDAEKRSRALGDARPVTRADLWQRVAQDMTEKPYKALAIDLVEAARKRRNLAVDIFLRQAHQIESRGPAGLNAGKELRDRARANQVRNTLGRSLAALDVALQRNETMSRALAQDATDHLRALRDEGASARRKIEQIAAATRRREIGSSPGP